MMSNTNQEVKRGVDGRFCGGQGSARKKKKKPGPPDRDAYGMEKGAVMEIRQALSDYVRTKKALQLAVFQTRRERESKEDNKE